MEYILLTGITSSIGKSIAMTLSNKYSIILAGRNATELEEIKSNLNGKNHVIWLCDFIKDDVAKNLKSFLEINNIQPSHFLHLGGMFSIAAIRLQKKEETVKIFQINVLSAIEIMTVLSKKEYKSNLKNVFFFSSISTIRGKSGYTVYAAAKSALQGLMRSLAIELKPIKVNTIVLGAVKTKATESIINANEEQINKSIPLGIANHEVLDQWMLFLLEGKTWMTGQEIIIDGGATIL